MYRDYLIKMLEPPQDNEIKWQPTVNTNQFLFLLPHKTNNISSTPSFEIMISAQFRMATPQYALIILHSTLNTY